MKKTFSFLTLSLLSITATTASAVEIYKKDGSSVQINGQFRPMLAHTEGERSDLRDRGSRVDFIFAQEMTEDLRLIGKSAGNLRDCGRIIWSCYLRPSCW